MKKLLVFLTIVASMLLFAVPAMAQEKAEWTVGSYPVITVAEGVRKQHDEYFLWYGTSEQKEMFEDYADRHMMVGIYLVQLGNAPDIRITCERDPKGWYAWYRDSRVGSGPTRPLHGELWAKVPTELRQTLSALDESDPNLLVIYACVLTHTIRVFYHPDYCTNKKFYEKMRLKAVSGFLYSTPSRPA